MAARKRIHTRGPDIPDAQRHTAKLQARVPTELDAAIREDADTYDLTLAEVLAVYRDLAVGSGRLAKVLHAAMVRAEHPEDYARAVRGEGPLQMPVIKGRIKQPSNGASGEKDT